MSAPIPVKVLFVCMGNICRSPTAEGVFRSLVDAEDLQRSILVDSAGTHGYHVGAPPDARAQATARGRGVDLSRLQARRFESRDFLEFDYLLAMDRNNQADMLALRPDDARAALHLMLEFSRDFAETEVPDPSYGDEGFDTVYDMIENASRGLLDHIRAREGL